MLLAKSRILTMCKAQSGLQYHEVEAVAATLAEAAVAEAKEAEAEAKEAEAVLSRAQLAPHTMPKSLWLSGSPFPRANGKYVQVTQLPDDAKEQPVHDFPIWKNVAHPEIHILRVNNTIRGEAWFISHYQPKTRDYYFATTIDLPAQWTACNGKADNMRMEFEGEPVE